MKVKEERESGRPPLKRGTWEERSHVPSALGNCAFRKRLHLPGNTLESRNDGRYPEPFHL